jgi:hypothetical protein
LYGHETCVYFQGAKEITSVNKQVHRKVYRPKRDEVSEKFKVFNNEEHCDLCVSPDIARAMKFKRIWGKREPQVRDNISIQYRLLVEKPVENWPLGRLRWRWDDNIKSVVTDIGCVDGRRVKLDQDHVQ